MSLDYFAVDAPPSVPAGTYVGTFQGIEPKDTEFGPRWRWTFEVAGPDGNLEVSTFTSQKFSSQTHAYELVASMTGRAPAKGERVAVQDLVGQRFHVMLSLKDNGWNKIEAVVPLPVPAVKLSTPFPTITDSADTAELPF